MFRRMKPVLILVMMLSLLLVSFPFSTVSADDGVPFSLGSPADVSENGTFDVYINIGTVISLTSWGFDVVYDDSVVQITGLSNGDGVSDGLIGAKVAPVHSWGPVANEGLPVTGNRQTVAGFVPPIPSRQLDGEGYLAKVTFDVLGAPGSSCQISVENPVLAYITGKKMEIGTITNAHVTVVEQDLDPPAQPTGLTALPGDQQALLTWNANTEEDLQSYKIYQSTDAGANWDGGTDVGNVSSCIVTGLTNSVPYTFAVTALDTSGNESVKSAPFTATPATGSGVPVSIGAPSEASENEIFDVYINIGEVENLGGWSFDLTYDNNVVQVPGDQNGSGVSDGLIGDVTLPLAGWATYTGGSWAGVPVNGDTIRVTGMMPDQFEAVSGDGSPPSYLAVVQLEVLGQAGDSSVLHVSNVCLSDAWGDPIVPLTNGDVTVNVVQDVTSPTVTGVNPVNNAQDVPTNTLQTAVFSERLDPATINEGSFTLEYDSTPVNGIVIYDNNAQSATFTPDAFLPAETTFTAAIANTVTDIAGNPLAGNNPDGSYSWTFTTGIGPDFEAPDVIAVNPVDGATNVPINTNITAVFSEHLNTLSLNSDSFVLKMGEDVVSAWVMYNRSTMTAKLATPAYLYPQTEYTVEIMDTVTDIAGNPLNGGTYTWSFTTGDDADLVSPEVTMVSPAGGAVNVGTNASLSAGFSETMNASTINGSNFTLVKTADLTPVAGTVNYTGTTATFVPAAVLEANTQYTAALSGYITDIAGNYLTTNDPESGDYVWKFTTGSGPDLIPPLVSGIYMVTTPEGVATNTSIAAVFTEPMDPTTINTNTMLLTQQGTPVSGTVKYVGVTAVFTPGSELLPYTTYTIMITTDVADTAGNHMENIFSLAFNTADLVNIVIPEAYLIPVEVSSTRPEPGETDVALDATITAKFTQPMMPDTVNTTTFILQYDNAQGGGGEGYVEENALVNVPCTVILIGANAYLTPVDDLLPNTEYTATVKAGVMDLALNAMESDYVWSFTTGEGPDITPPEISSTNPVNGAENVALDRAITATFTEGMDSLTINPLTFTLRNTDTDTFVDVQGVVMYSDTTATLYLELRGIELDPTTVYMATILGGEDGVKDTAGNAMVDDYIWSFTTGDAPDTIAPQVSSTSPAHGETDVAVDRAVTVTFTEEMYEIYITSANLKIKKTSDETLVPANVSYYGLTAILTPLNDLEYLTEYTVTVNDQVTDLVGNVLAGAPYSWSFTTADAPDTTPPKVTFTDPVRDEEDVEINRSISATFSEPVKEATVTTANFLLAETVSGEAVEGNVHYVGRTAIFTPLNLMKTGTMYTATVKNRIADLAGNRMEKDYTWSFTTGISSDITPPQVSSTYPANGETDVAINTDVKATFNEAMDATTINSQTFILQEEETGTIIPGGVTYSITTSKYALNAQMEAQTRYVATVTTGIKDLAGNSLAEDYSWSFTTGGEADEIYPTVTSTIPENNATGVALNTSVSATFSEEMDVDTVNNDSFTLWVNSTSVPGSVSAAGAVAVFTPEQNMEKETEYKAVISTNVRDLAGNRMETEYTWNFTTGLVEDNTLPEIILVQPPDEATDVALNQRVTATFSEAMNELTITNTTFTLEVSGNGTLVESAVTLYGDTAILDPMENLSPYTRYTATVYSDVEDLAGNNMENDYTWNFTTGERVDEEPPEVDYTDPYDGQTGVELLPKIKVTFTEAVNNSTVNTESFRLYKKNGLEEQVPGTVGYDPDNYRACFTPLADLDENTDYVALVTNDVRDLSGNRLLIDNDPLIEIYTWNFTTGTYPRIVITDPYDGEANVPLSDPITVTFDKEMNDATINTDSFTLWNGEQQVAGTVSYDQDNCQASFDPDSNLDEDTFYIAEVTNDMTDLDGNRLCIDNDLTIEVYTWNFTTGFYPRIDGTDPYGGETNVPISDPVTVTFDKNMNDATINTDSFTLWNGEQQVAGTVSYDQEKCQASFDPDSNLDEDTFYIAEVTNDVTDTDGNRLLIDEDLLVEVYTWNFTTCLYPTIVSTDPEDGKTGVSTSTNIEVLFNKGMDETTISADSFKLWDGAEQVEGTISYDAESFTATFDPAESLSRSTKYTAEITDAVKDTEGNQLMVNGALLVGSYTWDFTTVSRSTGGGGGGGGGRVVVLPSVTSVNPENNATGVNIGTAVSAVFGTAMNESTITAENFTLSSAQGAVKGSVAYNSATRKATFTPAGTLNYGTTYTATIGTGVRDTSGYALQKEYTWSFTTFVPPMGKMALSGFTSSAPMNIDYKGILQATVRLTTSDKKVTLDISQGTSLMKTGSKPLDSMSAASVKSPPAAPSGQTVIMAYEFGPQGAGFNPPITMIMRYDSLSRGVSEKSLFLAEWDGKAWGKLPSSSVDSASKAVRAKISHFSIYGLIGEVTPVETTAPPKTTKPAPTTTAPAPPPTTTKAPSPPPSTSAAPVATTTGGGLGGGAIAGIVIGALIVIALIIIFVRRWIRKNQ